VPSSINITLTSYNTCSCAKWRSPASLSLRKSHNILANPIYPDGSDGWAVGIRWTDGSGYRRGYLLEAGSPAEMGWTGRFSSATAHSDAYFSAPSLRSSYVARIVMTLTLIQRASMWTHWATLRLSRWSFIQCLLSLAATNIFSLRCTVNPGWCHPGRRNLLVPSSCYWITGNSTVTLWWTKMTAVISI